MMDSPVQYLKGVGPALAKKLAAMGINNISDLLNYYPSAYQDRSRAKKFAELIDGEDCLVFGKVVVSGMVETRYNLSIFKCALTDGHTYIWINVFRYVNPYKKFNIFQRYQMDFKKGNELYVWGTVQKKFGETNIILKEYELITTERSKNPERITPVYRLTSGITQKWIREKIGMAIEKYAGNLSEVWPQKGDDYLTLYSAIKNIHFPESFETLEKARRTLAFDEFMIFQTTLKMSRSFYRESVKTHGYQIKGNLLSPFRKNLGFDFTSSQKRAINEIFNDMRSPMPMNRILIGDVGCGKTAVAVSAMLLAVENGYQAVIMAPTEILAQQHFATLKKYLGHLDVKVELLTSSVRAKRRKYGEILRRISEGEVDIVAGTHSLAEPSPHFAKVKLFVIDEQHKFGVNQRLRLREKSPTADVLLMSATPIPRTLALTIYGDLALSFIKEMPPGRLPVKTFYMRDTEAYDFVKDELRKGNQAFIVYPLVENSEKPELKSAFSEADNLAKNVFNEFKVGLIYGKMKSDEKQKMMEDFRAGVVDVLIATSVVEVGIDIPGATVLVVEHAERFGLATLHQLRGRVARSDSQSYCIIVGDPKTEIARERMEILLKYSDGFEVAKADLKQRGPGDIIGTYQHGELKFKVGDILKDADLVELSNSLAEKIVAADGNLTGYPALKRKISEIYGGRVFLPQIG